MSDIMVGCSGWSYKAWDGPFYPRGTQPEDYLEFYSSVFDTVEIDSTFYSIPPQNSARKWNKFSPPGFKFSPKLPREITHERRLRSTSHLMEQFMESIYPIKEKIGMVLVQLPPSMNYDESFLDFQNFISDLPA